VTFTIRKLHLALGVLIVALIAPATAFATHVFDDVPDDKFYAEATEWAKDNNITTGSPAGSATFKPEDPVTRGETVTFMKRYDDNIVQPALGDMYTASEVDALVAASVDAKLDESDILWAAIASDGTVLQGSGIVAGNKGTTGIYRPSFDRDVTACATYATPSQAAGGFPTAKEVTVNQSDGSSDALYIQTSDSAGTLVDSGFTVLVLC